jgi:predicted enzyme related to lactoylglutathione lyase
MRPTWLTAFIDLTPEGYDAGVAFWEGVTGYSVSPTRGERDEFATLVPPEGDAYLRVQRVADGTGGVHLDVHRPGQQFEVRRSPGGLDYCEVSEPLSRRPPLATWPGGHRSQVDQVCLDIPPRAYERECAFWRDLIGLELQQSTYFEEFRTLVRPPDQPLRLLLQRVGDDRPRVTAHLDVFTTDREAEARRHEALGATVLREHEHFTVLTDPTGAAYCITPRDDETGMSD